MFKKHLDMCFCKKALNSLKRCLKRKVIVFEVTVVVVKQKNLAKARFYFD